VRRLLDEERPMPIALKAPSKRESAMTAPQITTFIDAHLFV
jgi:hypothetical protein